MGHFDGKVAVITGGSRGFGRATALAFAREGAHLVVNYRRSHDDAERLKNEIESLGSRAVLVQGDVGLRDDCRRIIVTAEEAFGRIDILVNNAGIMDVAEFAAQDESTWQSVMDVNVWGVVHTPRAALPIMIRQKHGRIVNLTSQLAFVGGPRFAFYSGTKGFVLAFSKSLAQEVGQYGITVNTVAPGGILTDMNRAIYPTEESRQKRAAALPVRRMGDPADVANCVLFLCEDASSYLTGQTLHPSGGNVML